MSTDYVIRSFRSVTPSRVTVTFVDGAGNIDSVTVQRNMTTPEMLDPIIQAAIASRRHPSRPRA